MPAQTRPGLNGRLENLLTLANGINKIFAEDRNVEGVVVTHGTSTLEETAYFLNLTIKHERPVILVGSMRPSTAISADGPLNLLNAVRTAIAPDARGTEAEMVRARKDVEDLIRLDEYYAIEAETVEHA